MTDSKQVETMRDSHQILPLKEHRVEGNISKFRQKYDQRAVCIRLSSR